MEIKKKYILIILWIPQYDLRGLSAFFRTIFLYGFILYVYPLCVWDLYFNIRAMSILATSVNNK